MARFSFGGDMGGWLVGYGNEATALESGITGRQAVALGGVNVQFWSAATGGVQYTDLTDASGVGVTEIQTSPGNASYPLGVLPRFFGPDGIAVMFAQAGSGPRLRITAVDAYNYFAGQIGGVTNLQSQITTLQGRVDTVETSQATVANTISQQTSTITTLENWRRFPVAEMLPTAQTTLTTAVWTTILFGAEHVDTDQDNVGGHSTTTNTGRYTFRYAGIYLVAGSISYNSNASGSRYTRWLINGVSRAGTATFTGPNPQGAITIHANVLLQQFAANDYIELQGYQSSGASLATYPVGEYSSHMSVVYLRPEVGASV